MKFNRKSITGLALAGVLCFGVAGTLAWLKDETVTVQNTFTTSGIDIDLNENGATDDNQDTVFEKNYKMIPGYTLEKDPKVTVKKGSEDCYVFIEVIKSSNLDDFISYQIDDTNWTKLTGSTATNDVYFKIVNASNADDDIELRILEDDVVTVKSTVTTSDMETLKNGVTAGTAHYPSLTFKAYAIQRANGNNTNFEPVEAWNTINHLAG